MYMYNTMLRIHKQILQEMENMISMAVNEKGEERAFTPEERAAFDSLADSAKKLKDLLEKNRPDEAKLLRAAFARR
jgi:hypothetical protein